MYSSEMFSLFIRCMWFIGAMMAANFSIVKKFLVVFILIFYDSFLNYNHVPPKEVILSYPEFFLCQRYSYGEFIYQKLTSSKLQYKPAGNISSVFANCGPQRLIMFWHKHGHVYLLLPAEDLTVCMAIKSSLGLRSQISSTRNPSPLNAGGKTLHINYISLYSILKICDLQTSPVWE